MYMKVYQVLNYKNAIIKCFIISDPVGPSLTRLTLNTTLLLAADVIHSKLRLLYICYFYFRKINNEITFWV